MAMDGLTIGLTECSRAIALGRTPRASTASPTVPTVCMLRMCCLDEKSSHVSTVIGHSEAWKLAAHELMHMPWAAERDCMRSVCNGLQSNVTGVKS